MRRAGANSTEVEIHDLINKLDNGSEHISFNEFCTVMMEKSKDVDQEIKYKETFRVFSKDSLGCISLKSSSLSSNISGYHFNMNIIP